MFRWVRGCDGVPLATEHTERAQTAAYRFFSGFASLSSHMRSCLPAVFFLLLI